MTGITEETRCRVCRGDLTVALDLGSIYPSAFLKPEESVSEERKAPLVLAECQDCGLVQLKHTVDLDLMYRQYWYSSSLNKSMVSSLQHIVRDIENRQLLQSGDKVLDIGCNDGTLLNLYNVPVNKVGFDPALNLQREGNFIFVNDYFSADKMLGLKPKVITAIAMFYDLPDPHQFVEDVKEVLHPDGIFVVQFTDLLSMIKTTAFDNICHEHLEYYTLRDVFNLLETHGLQVTEVSYNEVNGGSIRIVAAHEGRYPMQASVVRHLMDEKEYLKGRTLEYFKSNIETIKFKTREFLKWGTSHNLRIYLMGASTKGNTFLQVCGVTNKDVLYAAEVNSDKYGLRTVGSNIEIIPEATALIKHPDYFIVPVWHFKQSLISNNFILDYMRAGGKLVFPLPYFHVVFANDSGEIKEVRI